MPRADGTGPKGKGPGTTVIEATCNGGLNEVDEGAVRWHSRRGYDG